MSIINSPAWLLSILHWFMVRRPASFFVINFYGFPGQHLVRCSLSSPAAGIQTRRAVDNGSGDTKVGPRSLLADRHLSSKPVVYVTNLFLVEVAGDASAYPSPV